MVRGVARRSCTQSIEALAAFGVHWLTESDSRFPRSEWLQRDAGTITLSGAEAEFVTGAGSHVSVEYECDIDPGSRAVLEARARPRSLPPGINPR